MGGPFAVPGQPPAAIAAEDPSAQPADVGAKTGADLFNPSLPRAGGPLEQPPQGESRIMDMFRYNPSARVAGESDPSRGIYSQTTVFDDVRSHRGLALRPDEASGLWEPRRPVDQLRTEALAQPLPDQTAFQIHYARMHAEEHNPGQLRYIEDLLYKRAMVHEHAQDFIEAIKKYKAEDQELEQQRRNIENNPAISKEEKEKSLQDLDLERATKQRELLEAAGRVFAGLTPEESMQIQEIIESSKEIQMLALGYESQDLPTRAPFNELMTRLLHPPIQYPQDYEFDQALTAIAQKRTPREIAEYIYATMQNGEIENMERVVVLLQSLTAQEFKEVNAYFNDARNKLSDKAWLTMFQYPDLRSFLHHFLNDPHTYARVRTALPEGLPLVPKVIESLYPSNWRGKGRFGYDRPGPDESGRPPETFDKQRKRLAAIVENLYGPHPDFKPEPDRSRLTIEDTKAILRQADALKATLKDPDIDAVTKLHEINQALTSLALNRGTVAARNTFFAALHPGLDRGVGFKMLETAIDTLAQESPQAQQAAEAVRNVLYTPAQRVHDIIKNGGNLATAAELVAKLDGTALAALRSELPEILRREGIEQNCNVWLIEQFQKSRQVEMLPAIVKLCGGTDTDSQRAAAAAEKVKFYLTLPPPTQPGADGGRQPLSRKEVLERALSILDAETGLPPGKLASFLEGVLDNKSAAQFLDEFKAGLTTPEELQLFQRLQRHFDGATPATELLLQAYQQNDPAKRKEALATALLDPRYQGVLDMGRINALLAEHGIKGSDGGPINVRREYRVAFGRHAIADYVWETIHNQTGPGPSAQASDILLGASGMGQPFDVVHALSNDSEIKGLIEGVLTDATVAQGYAAACSEDRVTELLGNTALSGAELEQARAKVRFSLQLEYFSSSAVQSALSAAVDKMKDPTRLGSSKARQVTVLRSLLIGGTLGGSYDMQAPEEQSPPE